MATYRFDNCNLKEAVMDSIQKMVRGFNATSVQKVESTEDPKTMIVTLEGENGVRFLLRFYSSTQDYAYAAVVFKEDLGKSINCLTRNSSSVEEFSLTICSL